MRYSTAHTSGHRIGCRFLGDYTASFSARAQANCTRVELRVRQKKSSRLHALLFSRIAQCQDSLLFSKKVRAEKVRADRLPSVAFVVCNIFDLRLVPAYLALNDTCPDSLSQSSSLSA